MSHFAEDSPAFRRTLQQYESSLIEISEICKDWCEKAVAAHSKGEEYCLALKAFHTSIDESVQANCFSIYKPLLQTISDILQTIQACNEGSVFSLLQVFTMDFNPFLDSLTQELPILKKNYEKLQKDTEYSKSQSLSYKKAYVISIKVKKNPMISEEHFLKVHSIEKQYELARFDYFSFLSNSYMAGQILAVEQALSMLYSIYVIPKQSFTNTALDRYKAHEKEITKISEKIQLSKKGLTSIQETLKKEREVEEMKTNLFVKIPQYKDDKSGYLWKRGNLITEWKRRYFFIKNSQLIYLREEEEIVYATLLMSKTLELKESDYLYAFEIITVSPEQRLTLIAESDSELKEWLYVLKKSSEQGLLGYNESEYACADCLTPSPEWCSLNLGVLLCTACSGIHRSLGSHVSKVRSLHLDTIDSLLKEAIIDIHSSHQIIWGEGFRPPRFSSTEDKELYIRGKYQHKSWFKTIDNPTQALIAAASENDVAKAFHAILSGVKAKENPALHIAAKSGALKIVALLVFFGWELEAKNKEAFTPLEVALLANQNEVVEYLVRIISG